MTQFLDLVFSGKKLHFYKNFFDESEFPCANQKTHWVRDCWTDLWLYFEDVEQKEWDHWNCYRAVADLENEWTRNP